MRWNLTLIKAENKRSFTNHMFSISRHVFCSQASTCMVAHVCDIVWEQVYSRGKFVLKASHWSRNVHWDIVVVKSFGGKFATSSEGNYWGLKFSPMEANMKTRLESKSFVTPVNKPFCLPNLVATYISLLLVNF